MKRLSTTDPLVATIRLLRPRLPRLALAIGFGVLSLGSALALAAVAAWLIARAWQMPPILDLSIAVVAVRALGISRGIFGYCERLASHDTALRAAGTTRSQLYRRLATAPADTAMRWHGGQLVSRLGGSVDDLSDVLVRALLPIAIAAILSVGAVVSIAVISPTAAVVLTISLAVAGIIAPWLAARAASAAENVAVLHHAQRDTAAMLALEHAPELRVAGRLDGLIAESTRRQRDWGAADDRAALPTAFAAAMPTVATATSVLGAVIAAAMLAPTAAPTTLAILMLLPMSAFEATTALPGAGVQLVRARIATSRISDLTSAAASRARPAITVPDLADGDRMAVVGPSGSGKTTLLIGIVDAHRDPMTAGFFAEDAHVFDTTVRDNLLVARGDAGDDDIITAIEAVGLTPWLNGLPDGLSTVLNGGAAAMSAGQRRRLLLARALVSTFPVVLLDEPTEHLDAMDADRMLADILTPGALFDTERTVVVATHHLPSGLSCPVLTMGRYEYPHQT